MGFRFRRSIKIAPGVRLNLSKSGISTTLGARGASVNIGKRGTYANAGIPGTGISYREKVGSGTRAQRGSGGGGSEAANGCAGCGCLSMLGLGFLLLLGMCSGPDRTSARPDPPPRPYSTATATGSVPPAAETFYLHGAMNVRSGPGSAYPVTRTFDRGAAVQLGPKDASGWAPLFIAGAAAGYLYRASDLVRAAPPSVADPERAASTAGRSSRSAAESNGYYTGPRGGCYTYSASGRKRYVDRSFCR